MKWERRQQINKLADLVREAIGYDKAPYDPKLAIKLLGGELINDDSLMLKDIDAKIIKTDGKFQICINPLKPGKRAVFSLAHELGHLFLHMGFLINKEKWNNTDEYVDSYYRDYNNMDIEEEYEANEFAAAFLMPKDEFLKLVTNNQIGTTIKTNPIAEYFNVSNDAVANRGRWLGVFQW